jgi:hypothetical protein
MGETPRRGRAAHRAHRQDRRRRSDQELLSSLQEPPHPRCPPAANRHPHHRPPAAGCWTCGRANPSPRRARGRSGIPRFPGREAPVTLPQACSWRETYRRSGASTPLRISFAFSWELVRAKLVPATSPVGHATMREMPPRRIRAANSARSSRRPAGPTKGRPARSPSWPGCWPIIITRAWFGPSPNTVWVPRFQRSQARQLAAVARSVGRVRRAGMKCAAEPVPSNRRAMARRNADPRPRSPPRR